VAGRDDATGAREDPIKLGMEKSDISSVGVEVVLGEVELRWS
jgi:hypothetical protein